VNPLSINLFPLSFEGEGDKGGEVSKHSQNDRKGGFMAKVVKGASGLSGAGSWGKSKCRGSAEKCAQWKHSKQDRACLSCEQL